MTLEKFMIKAIKKFEKENKDGQIRNVYAWEFCVDGALFNIEYVDGFGRYQETQIYIKEEKNEN